MKLDLFAEVLRVSTVVSAAKNWGKQTMLLAGELVRVIESETKEMEVERNALAARARLPLSVLAKNARR